MRRTVSGHAVVFHKGDAAELHVDYFDAVPPPAFADDCREILNYLAGTNRVPGRIRKGGSDLTGTDVCYGVLKVRHLEQRPLDVGYSPSDYSIEAYRLIVLGRSGEADEMVDPRSYVVMEYRVDVERRAPMKARIEFSFELSEADEQPSLEREQNDKGHQELEEPLDDFEDSIEHWLLREGVL